MYLVIKKHHRIINSKYELMIQCPIIAHASLMNNQFMFTLMKAFEFPLVQSVEVAKHVSSLLTPSRRVLLESVCVLEAKAEMQMGSLQELMCSKRKK